MINLFRINLYIKGSDRNDLFWLDIIICFIMSYDISKSVSVQGSSVVESLKTIWLTLKNIRIRHFNILPTSSWANNFMKCKLCCVPVCKHVIISLQQSSKKDYSDKLIYESYFGAIQFIWKTHIIFCNPPFSEKFLSRTETAQKVKSKFGRGWLLKEAAIKKIFADFIYNNVW